MKKKAASKQQSERAGAHSPQGDQGKKLERGEMMARSERRAQVGDGGAHWRVMRVYRGRRRGRRSVYVIPVCCTRHGMQYAHPPLVFLGRPEAEHSPFIWILCTDDV
jgi:hypothetical protein